MKRRRRRNAKHKNQVVMDQEWKLSLLREFIARHGWKKLKPATVRSGVNLHRWVMHRRADYQADRIPDWLAPACETIPGWSWDAFRDAYVRNLDNLRAFVRTHGWDALSARPTIEGTRLDKWVAHRRDEYRHGELDTWLIRGLEAIPGWTWDPLQARYEQSLRELRDHVARYGWAAIQAHTISTTGSHVGEWVGAMRARRRRGELSEQIEAELQSIPGWTWDPNTARQLATVERLATFVASHGWESVSAALSVDGFKLGAWVSNCRARHRRGGLAPETVVALEALPGWSWSGADARAQFHRQNADRISTRIAALEASRTPRLRTKKPHTRKRRRAVDRSSVTTMQVAVVPVSIPIPSKRVVLAELTKLTRAAGSPLPSNRLPFGLYNALLHHFGGIHRARGAAKLPDPPQARDWTPSDVTAEIRRLYDIGLTIRCRDLELAGREDLVGAIRTYLGGIVRARVLACVPHPPRATFAAEAWDEDRVLEEITELHGASEPLAYSKAPSKLVNAAVRYLGSWDNALFAAGLDPEEIRLRRKPYTDEQLSERMHALAREQPTMNRGELFKHPAGQALWRRYGSLEAGLEAMGLTTWPRRVMHDAYSAEEVVAALQARHRAGKSLGKTALEEDARLLLGITRRFKTLGVALAAAGLQPLRDKRSSTRK